MNITLPLTQTVLDWITEHPYQTFMHVANGIIICTPAVVTVPIFSALRFGAVGPGAATPASSMMGYLGVVPANGLYTTLRSAAMSGYGASIAAGAAQAGAVASFTAAWVLGWHVNNGTRT